jgi:hypothetical protein
LFGPGGVFPIFQVPIKIVMASAPFSYIDKNDEALLETVLTVLAEVAVLVGEMGGTKAVEETLGVTAAATEREEGELQTGEELGTNEEKAAGEDCTVNNRAEDTAVAETAPSLGLPALDEGAEWSAASSEELNPTGNSSNTIAGSSLELLIEESLTSEGG